MGSREPEVRRVENGHQPAHPVETEPHSEQLEREQIALCLFEGPSGPAHQSSLGTGAVNDRDRSALELRELTLEPGQLLPLLAHQFVGSLLDETLVGELALGPCDFRTEVNHSLL